MAFSPDGQRILTASDDKTVQSAGMFVGAKACPLLPATAPAGLTASEGDHDATLDLTIEQEVDDTWPGKTRSSTSWC